MANEPRSTEWLIAYLREHGPTENRQLMEAAKQANLRGAGRGLAYAKKAAGVVYDYRAEFQGGLVVRLPDQEPLPRTRVARPDDRAALRQPEQAAPLLARLAGRTARQVVRDDIVAHHKPYEIIEDAEQKILHVYLDADWRIRTYENTD